MSPTTTTTVALSTALLLLLPGTLAEGIYNTPIKVAVQNSILNISDENYEVTVAYRAILLSGLTRLMNSTSFNFTYSDDPNYGPYLETVNGVAGSNEDHTYWELLADKANGTIIRPDVGIGCYIPSANEQIILNFTRW